MMAIGMEGGDWYDGNENARKVAELSERLRRLEKMFEYNQEKTDIKLKDDPCHPYGYCNLWKCKFIANEKGILKEFYHNQCQFCGKQFSSSEKGKFK